MYCTRASTHHAGAREKGKRMRRIRIQKQRPRGRVSTHLQGGWKPIQDLKTPALTTPLTNDERVELEQRRRLHTLIQEHAVA
jgi:hypothetical protein